MLGQRRGRRTTAPVNLVRPSISENEELHGSATSERDEERKTSCVLHPRWEECLRISKIKYVIHLLHCHLVRTPGGRSPSNCSTRGENLQ
eukprot:1189509-Prorocentrum_minimum.AAC.1